MNSTETRYVDLSLTKSFFLIKTNRAASNLFWIPIQLIQAIVLTQDTHQSNQNESKQFGFDTIIMNQHNSMILAKICFA
jgi:hypothetical protein